MKLNFDRTLAELAKFNFVLSEGRRGNHWLFDADLIRDTFSRNSDQLNLILRDRLGEINEALNKTFEHVTFEEKRRFIGTLPQDVRDGMIFGYFQLLDDGGDEAPRTNH